MPLASVWDSDRVTVTRPRLVAGNLVQYTVRQKALYLTALDPATGDQVWEVPTTRSGLTQGVALGLQVVGPDQDQVLTLRQRLEDASDELVLRDARTGDEVWAADLRGSFQGVPGPCLDDDTRLCDPGRDVIFRISLEDGSVETVVQPAGRSVGGGMLDTREGGFSVCPTNRVAGAVRWKTCSRRTSRPTTVGLGTRATTA